MKKLFLFFFLGLSACPRPEPQEPTEQVKPVSTEKDPKSTTTPAATSDKGTVLTGEVTYSQLEALADQKVTVTGKISKIPWQHMMGGSPTYKYDEYFDLEGGFQIVIYSKEKIECEGKPLEVTGAVVKISGPGKRSSPDDPEHTEYHINVDSWKCGG